MHEDVQGSDDACGNQGRISHEIQRTHPVNAAFRSQSLFLSPEVSLLSQGNKGYRVVSHSYCLECMHVVGRKAHQLQDDPCFTLMLLSDNILLLLMVQWTPDEGSSLNPDVTPLEPLTSSRRPASGRDRGKSG